MATRIQENSVRISMLLDIYGELLTEKQREALEMHFDLDYSLSEIAENIDASRQAALDQIRRGAEKLEHFEAVLGLYKKTVQMESDLSQIESWVRTTEVAADVSACIANIRKTWEER